MFAIQPKSHFIICSIVWKNHPKSEVTSVSTEVCSKKGHAKTAQTRWRKHCEATTMKVSEVKGLLLNFPTAEVQQPVNTVYMESLVKIADS